MTLAEKLDKILIQGGSWKTILRGLWVTVQISELALILGTILGALICPAAHTEKPCGPGVCLRVYRGAAGDAGTDVWQRTAPESCEQFPVI